MKKQEDGVDLVREKRQLEATNPALTQGFFRFVESFRKYTEMQRRVVSGPYPLSGKGKR